MLPDITVLIRRQCRACPIAYGRQRNGTSLLFAITTTANRVHNDQRPGPGVQDALADCRRVLGWFERHPNVSDTGHRGVVVRVRAQDRLVAGAAEGVHGGHHDRLDHEAVVAA